MLRYYPNFAQLPSDICDIPHWLRWSFLTRKGQEKPSKVPVSPATSTNPATWSTLDYAREKLERYWRAPAGDREDGLGFALGRHGKLNFVGIDLDGSIESFVKPRPGQPVTEFTVADWAKPIVDAWPGYLEISPSGRGLKGIGIGRLSAEWLNRAKITVDGIEAGELELYDRGRFFTLTGLRLASHATIVLLDVQAAIDAICLSWGSLRAGGQLDRKMQEEITVVWPLQLPTKQFSMRFSALAETVRKTEIYLICHQMNQMISRELTKN